MMLAMSGVRIHLEPHDPTWVDTFTRIAARVDRALRGTPATIYHIGSTSIPGIAAKPVIDIQVSVAATDGTTRIVTAMQGAGFAHFSDNDDRRKLFFALAEGDTRLANVHVRRRGEFSEQAALLFRDYLRAEPEAAARYEAVKHDLAVNEWTTVNRYADAKGDVVWELLREADLWAQDNAWIPPPVDFPHYRFPQLLGRP
jgi:GrpB-like predicted nucleotidyltransferase (UPF0157 family)